MFRRLSSSTGQTAPPSQHQQQLAAGATGTGISTTRSSSSYSSSLSLGGDDAPLKLSLNGNVFVFKPGKQWVMESSDLDIAAAEINKITDEKELLILEIEELHKEIIETNEMKTVALGMAIDERQKNALLEQELSAYKGELREAYRMIVELKRAIPH